MNLIKDIALDYIRDEHPQCAQAYMAGSIIRGEGKEHSDLDIVIIYTKLDYAYRKSLKWKNQFMEVFVHDEQTLAYFIQNMDIPRAIPSLAHMIVEGVPLKEEDQQTTELKKQMGDLLSKGPLDLTTEEIDRRRYFIADTLYDLRDADRESFEFDILKIQLLNLLGDFYLRTHNQWSGSHKWLLKRLKESMESSLYERFETTFFSKDLASIESLVMLLLSDYDGLLWEGYSAQAPSDWRI